MSELLGVDLPVRKHRDWHKATTGTCCCGRWGAIMDKQCPECHEADYQAEKEAAYQKRIRELIAENNVLKAKLSHT